MRAVIIYVLVIFLALLVVQQFTAGMKVAHERVQHKPAESTE